MISSILNSEWLRLSRMIDRECNVLRSSRCREDLARPPTMTVFIYQMIFTVLSLRYTRSAALLFTFPPVFCIVLSLPASCGVVLALSLLLLERSCSFRINSTHLSTSYLPSPWYVYLSLRRLPRLGEVAYLRTNAGQHRGTQRLLARPYWQVSKKTRHWDINR
jgi:hypothetical protein